MTDGAQVPGGIGGDALLEGSSPDFAFLPQVLNHQCRSLIESYHDLHGYGCLPDILWKAGLGPFIETHRDFRQLLRKASMNRSAKKSSAGFTQIAATLLSLEILASNFAGWSLIYPQAASRARSILKRHAPLSQTRLMGSYLYPPKYKSSAALAMLSLPTKPEAETDAVTPSPDELPTTVMQTDEISALVASSSR
jgi:hypothetical protein